MSNPIPKSVENLDLINAISCKAQDFFEGNGGSHGWDRTRRVCKLALRIGEKEGANLEIVEIAAILHDIAREEQDKSKGEQDHARLGTILASNVKELNYRGTI
jgi:uncharacterized protein